MNTITRVGAAALAPLHHVYVYVGFNQKVGTRCDLDYAILIMGLLPRRSGIFVVGGGASGKLRTRRLA